jgi:hypothetical protein
MNELTNHQIDILFEIANLPRTKFSSDDPGVISRLDSVSAEIRAEIAWLFVKYPNLGIFKEETGPPNWKSSNNSWQLSSSYLDLTLADTFMGGEKYDDQGDYMWNYLQFGFSCRDGGVGICTESAMFGKIAFCTFTASSERGDIPVVANSFTEWVERTIHHGPDAICYYWETSDFIDLGPAIPNDPSYRPIGRVL